MRFEVYASTLAFLTAAILPASAAAYVGPGAGLSLIGSTIGLIVALGMAVGFVLIWPLRRLLRRRATSHEGSRPDHGSTAAS